MEKILGQKKFAAHPKIYEVFKALSEAGTKIALYSDYNLIKERALSCGIKQEALDLCKCFYSSETLGCLKPAPRGFLQIAADLGAKPKECLVVGDRDDTDGQGARNAGMKFVQIKTKAQRPVWDLLLSRKTNGLKRGPTVLYYSGHVNDFFVTLFQKPCGILL